METIKGKKLNKGEWAEFYVMLRLLGDGKLYSADKLLRKNYNYYLDILKVIRQEVNTGVLEYVINGNNVIIRVQKPQRELATIPKTEFMQNATALFDGIKNLKGNSVPAPDDVCEFARIIFVSKPKAPSVKSLKKQFGGKSDIFVEVRDGQTSIVSVMGFSIKSKFGQNPTLFNAGSSSQFLFKLSGCNDDMMQEFNDISDNQGRGWALCREYLKTHNIGMEYFGTQYPTYENNLFLVRENMSKILAWCVKNRLIDMISSNNVKETVEEMCRINPLKVPNPEIYYVKAIKDFLMAGFTGMTAGQTWNGEEQVNGGYIVVMEDGDVLCYHSNDREAFRDYLYRNTFFEYVSAEKYNWSRILKTDNEYYLPLNVSVRFNKQTR